MLRDASAHGICLGVLHAMCMLYASRCLHCTPSHPQPHPHTHPHPHPPPTLQQAPTTLRERMSEGATERGRVTQERQGRNLTRRPCLIPSLPHISNIENHRCLTPLAHTIVAHHWRTPLAHTIAASHHWRTPPHVERAHETGSGRGGRRSRETKDKKEKGTKHRKERETKHKRAVMTESVKSKVKEASWPSSEASTPTESNVIDSMSSSSTPAFRSNHVAVCMFACIHMYIYTYVYIYIYTYV